MGLLLSCQRRLKDISVRVLAKWVRLLRHSQRVRKLQRIRGVLGPFLRDRYSSDFKRSLLTTWPQLTAPSDFSVI